MSLNLSFILSSQKIFLLVNLQNFVTILCHKIIFVYIICKTLFSYLHISKNKHVIIFQLQTTINALSELIAKLELQKKDFYRLNQHKAWFEMFHYCHCKNASVMSSVLELLHDVFMPILYVQQYALALFSLLSHYNKIAKQDETRTSK